MMKFLLFAFFALPTLAFAQSERATLPARTANAILETNGFQKSAPEVIFPGPIDSLECANTAVLFTFQSITGFFTGTNGEQSEAVIQRFTYDVNVPYILTEIGVAFGTSDSLLTADRTVAVSVYEDFTPQGRLGTFMGTSDSIRVGDLLLPANGSIQFTNFTFDEPLEMTSDSFLVLVDLSDVYEAPTGDVAVYSTPDSCGDGNNAFAIYPNPTQDNPDGSVIVPYSALGGPDGANIELFIRAVVDTDIQVSTRQPLADYTTTLAPNPTSNRLTLSYQSPGAENFTATITDLAGRILLKSRASATSGTNTFDWDLSALPAGLYLYHLDGPQGRQSGKVTKL